MPAGNCVGCSPLRLDKVRHGSEFAVAMALNQCLRHQTSRFCLGLLRLPKTSAQDNDRPTVRPRYPAPPELRKQLIVLHSKEFTKLNVILTPPREEHILQAGLRHLTVTRTIRPFIVSAKINEIDTSGCFERAGSILASFGGLLVACPLIGTH